MAYEVFAVSEEGTETVFVSEDKSEALEKRLELQRELDHGVWSNTTSLHNVVGFNVDEGPDSDAIEVFNGGVYKEGGAE